MENIIVYLVLVYIVCGLSIATLTLVTMKEKLSFLSKQYGRLKGKFLIILLYITWTVTWPYCTIRAIKELYEEYKKYREILKG